MTLTVIRNAVQIVCMDDPQREIADGAITFRDGIITNLGTTAELAAAIDVADRIVDARGCVVAPGLVNTHHHLYQSLMRAVPAGINASLFGWPECLYPIWARYLPEGVFAATQLGLAEPAGRVHAERGSPLPVSGRRDARQHDHCAAEIDIRFHPTRGGMSVGISAGGLPPDSLVEDEGAILDDAIRLIVRFHDPADGVMLPIGVAPCSPFSVSRELMRDAALPERDMCVLMETHLGESTDDVAFSLARFGCRPGQYAESLGWTGPGVWHAHCVQLDLQEIDLFARTRTGIAHCPSSNCPLGSGIMPLALMFARGVPLGLGVDGSASNNCGNLLLEARQAMLLQRAIGKPGASDPRDALYLATRGGARMLRREDCGILASGKRADIAVWNVSDTSTLGAWEPVAALVLCPPVGAGDVFVEGRAIVRDGDLVTTSRHDILRAADRSLARLRSLI